MNLRPIHLAMAVGLCIWWGAATPAFAEKGWKLEQAGDYLGPMTCYVGKKSIRIVLGRYGINFCLSSADYKVIGYNDKTKTYFSEDYKVWRERFLASRINDEAESVQDGTAAIANFKVKRYLVQSTHGPRAAGGPTHNGRMYNTEMFISDEIKTPTQFVSLLTALTYLPSNLGFPIKVVRYSPMGARTIAWNTLTSQRAEVTDKFSIPKGYTPVDSELALFVGGMGEMGLAPTAGAVFEHGVHMPSRSSISSAPRWAPGMDTDESDTPIKSGPGAPPPRSTGTQARYGEWAPGF
ncbi:MAG TPA: hypothetical protein V6D22_11085 [Candidatus Obscuribacterales bacterium]